MENELEIEQIADEISNLIDKLRDIIRSDMLIDPHVSQAVRDLSDAEDNLRYTL
jgi:chemotaxis regulatin CheY-phosphate phosphatase CheZ